MQESRIRMMGGAGLLSAILLLAGTGGVAAQPTVMPPNFQSGSMTGIGYSAVLPSAAAGAGVWHLFGTSRFGVFVDAKMTQPSVTNDANYCPERLIQCDVEYAQANYNHFLVEEIEEWLIVNAGGMYAVTEEFALMLGAGMVRTTELRQFSDDNEIDEERMTYEGNYYVPFAETGNWEVQAAASGLIRAHPRFAFSFGYETGPGNMNAGIFLVLH